MVKVTEILGKLVIAREGGQEAGKVRDVVVDEQGRRVLAIVVSEGMLKGTRIALWQAVRAVGPDSVIIDSRASVVKASQHPEIKTLMEKGKPVRGLRVHTTEGKDLGRIEDIHFDEKTGDILGYELSGGLLSSTVGGRSFMPTPPTMEIGKDVAFVSREVESTIRQGGGGLLGVFRRAEKDQQVDE